MDRIESGSERKKDNTLAVIYLALRSNGFLFNDISACLLCRNLAKALLFSYHVRILYFVELCLFVWATLVECDTVNSSNYLHLFSYC
jgi:hypothetical protein